jgi:syntaxin 1B/2/3
MIQETIGVSSTMDNAIKDMREKVADIRKLQESVQNLCQMVEELKNIIKSQNELLDSIENNMKEVNDYLGKGLDKLKLGVEEYMSAQEKFCCIFFVMIIVAIIGLNHFLDKMNIF